MLQRHYFLPMAAVTRGRIAAAKSAVRLARVRKRQEDLVEQWGEPVRKLAE